MNRSSASPMSDFLYKEVNMWAPILNIIGIAVTAIIAIVNEAEKIED